MFGEGRRIVLELSGGGRYRPVRLLRLTVYDDQPFAALQAGVRNPFAFMVPEILPPAANAAETVSIKTAGKNTITRHLFNFYTSCNYQTLLVIKIS